MVATVNESLHVGDRVVARVVKLMPFGAFVHLGASELVGLIKIPELSWRPIRHPQEILAVGQEVEAQILAFNLESKQVLLSLKRCHTADE
ncbi:MAG: S1 RNA-binding domain-containing protein [Anaerolineae bacterium]|nr:S1 RNA-binding domain-containing protein [Anaerolineae bacterium]